MHNDYKTPELNINLYTGLAAYFLSDNLLTKESLKNAILCAEKQGLALGCYLFKNTILSSKAILSCCAKYFNLPIAEIENYNFTNLQNSIITSELMFKYRILPLHYNEHSLHLGVTDPSNYSAISVIEFHTGLQIHIMLISQEDFDKITALHLPRKRLDNQLESTLLKISSLNKSEEILPVIEENDEPVSNFIKQLILDALEECISDIHLEPFAKNCRIRFRRDGLLYQASTIPLHLAIRIITRLKILSQLNIAERRLPQDGRLQLPEFINIDIRINTCPTLYGEKIVLRILNANKIALNINELGMTDTQKDLFLTKLQQPQGLILVTGPTGSGKTITLYSALHYLNQIEKNVSSVEDPVEIELAGINQMSINTRIGLDFTIVLRALMRQDPDIIMLGEIRDTETAEIAVQAAQTGHLVLSTLHTNTAFEALTRFQSMQINIQYFSNALTLIIAQRLVRKLCVHCKQKKATQASLIPQPLKEFQVDLYYPQGCERCHQGYKGRTGIFEMIDVFPEIFELLTLPHSAEKVKNKIKQKQALSLREAGMEIVKQGLTSYAEILRVLGGRLYEN